MFGIGKKKATPQGKMVWMIKQVSSGLFLGVCKDQLVHLKIPTACFRFSDIDAASLFLYWLIQRKEIKEGEYQVVYAMIEEAKDGK